jgi:hypothetical protein
MFFNVLVILFLGIGCYFGSACSISGYNNSHGLVSWDIPADSGLLSGKSNVLRNTIKCTHCMARTPYLPQYQVFRHTLFSLAYVCAVCHAYSDSTFIPV